MQEKILITSKGNGKNFYAYIKGKVHECLKIRGRFYLAKLFLGEGLRAMGEPLKNFTLVT